ncbi:MAG: hypothetical protein ACRC41_00810 [Sarcina sp.]
MKTKYLKTTTRMQRTLKLILVTLLTLTICSTGLKLTNNILHTNTSKIVIEKSLEYNAFNATKNLETLRDIKENLEKYTERKINKFTHTKHKFHTEKKVHL